MSAKLAAFGVTWIVLTIGACSPTNNGYEQYKLMESVAKKGESSYKLYKTSDFQTAKSALLDFVSHLEELAQTDNPEQYAFQVDIVWTYVRLAKLEERYHGSEKENYMKKAEAQCGLLKPKEENCSPEKLRELVDKADRVEPK